MEKQNPKSDYDLWAAASDYWQRDIEQLKKNVLRPKNVIWVEGNKIFIMTEETEFVIEDSEAKFDECWAK